ncbi:leucine--tRNA ligase [Jonesia quinghaiensis]|uniref:leucine--tRNA ligase n=1 Tax=Jonesia quinghaiensis TaxID=262806 RepID=UPI000422A595|nr:leucine--tRNA ligase [Jonesia quinghaiensis]
MNTTPNPQQTAAYAAPTEPSFRYTADLAQKIELRWQQVWEEQGTYHAADPVGGLTDGKGLHADPDSPSFFVMDMFPFPSGAGLHVGHPLGYIATDAVARFRRMNGDNVLHALGFDAFGLPTELYAIQTGQHPRQATQDNIANMQRQLRRMGLGHDSRRSFATTDTDYVRWTQWIFLQIFNSWYDEAATNPAGSLGCARPISELEQEFSTGVRAVPPVGDVVAGTPWGELTPAQRTEVLNHFRLAYVSESPVNWCPGLGTVLANEEVTAEGRSERGNFPVFQRAMRQWNMRITAYSDRLIDDLASIDWPEKVKSMQRHWVGRSEGAHVAFTAGEHTIEVFTTRPDTLFGATFMVVAPEHPILETAVPTQWPDGTRDAWTGGYDNPAHAVTAYQAEASAKTAVERQADAKKKTGVFTGIFATNPVDGRQIPVFTADYVLMGYGTGAIMAVPGGDDRDYAFAQAFDLDVVYTVAPPQDFAGDSAWTGDGDIINSSNEEISLNGMTVPQAKSAIISWLEQQKTGTGTVTYRLRDWLFSRQRYWGEPFPIVYDENDQPIAVPESMLPIALPDTPDFAPRTFDPQDAESQPEPPLGRNDEWVNVDLDLGDGVRTYRRETNTMPNWAGSCWYYLRYIDPTNNASDSQNVVSRELEQYWVGPHHNEQVADAGGVDLYVGGVEHAVLHLLYARFWHKVLFDLGHVSSPEPFHKLFNQGYVQAYAYTDARGQYVPAAEVEEHTDESGSTVYTWQGQPVAREYGKMGKSLKNVVTPDEMYENYGADTFRVYEMSMGPLDLSRPWETRAVVGAQRFLQRLWRNVLDENTGEVTVSEEPGDVATLRALHKTIVAVREEMSGMRINTAIAKLIELNNHLTSLPQVPRAAAEALVIMVAPVAPHIAEELWHKLGHTDSVVYQPFPVAEEKYLVEDTVTTIFQVQGKVRGKGEVSPSISDEDLQALALDNDGVKRTLDGRGIRKIIVRAPKLVNIVPE